MRTIYLLLIVTLWSCQSKDNGIVQSLTEKDTISIKYPFADLKHVTITNVRDTVTIEIMLRNLTDKIQYSDSTQSLVSFNYQLDLVAHVSDTSTFKIEFFCSQKDTSKSYHNTMFRTYFGENVDWIVAEYIQRGNLHFYKRYDAPYLRLTDTTMILKMTKVPSNILKSFENDLTVRVWYHLPDTLCEKVVWCDFLQSDNSKLKEERGYIRTNCYADGYIAGPQNDTTITYAPYDIK
jgi:hypothetical protein